MKKLTTKLFSALLLCTLAIPGVHAQNCQSAAMTHLNANNIDALLTQGGRFWTDGQDGGYFAPKNDPNQVKALFAGSLWMAGLDPGGNIKVAAATYGTTAGGESGPLINGLHDPSICEQFNRFWEVSSGEVEAHIADFNDNGVIDNPIPSILAWPALNNPESPTSNGFALPQNIALAPFVDVDLDGSYEPMSGDYPEIKGDQNIWWVYHSGGDGANNATPTMTCQVLAYASNSIDENVSNTTFYDVKLVHEGTENLQDFYAGLWLDPDLGCYTDDYAGCYPDENFAFIYNSDAMDGTVGCSCDGGVATYCEEIPVLSIKWLDGLLDENGIEHGMSSFSVFNNASVGNFPPGTGDPSSDIEFYNYLKGVWKDGTPMTTGGNGYQSGGDITKYMYPGSPADMNEWTMCSEALPPSDIRLLMSTGPVTMQPGAVNQFTFAVIFVPNQQYPCPDIQPIVAAGEAAELYNLVLSPIQEPEFSGELVTVKPNPASDQILVTVAGEQLIQQLEILNMDGKLLRHIHAGGVKQLELLQEEISNGLYFYKATLSNGQIAAGKLVWE